MSERTEIPLLLLRLDLDLCTIKGSLCDRCMNERISPFELATLTFELCTHKHHVFLALSGSESQNVAKFSKKKILKKGWTIPLEKCPFLLDIDFLMKEITNLT
jgi:hypothetical protein